MRPADPLVNICCGPDANRQKLRSPHIAPVPEDWPGPASCLGLTEPPQAPCHSFHCRVTLHSLCLPLRVLCSDFQAVSSEGCSVVSPDLLQMLLLLMRSRISSDTWEHSVPLSLSLPCLLKVFWAASRESARQSSRMLIPGEFQTCNELFPVSPCLFTLLIPCLLFSRSSSFPRGQIHRLFTPRRGGGWRTLAPAVGVPCSSCYKVATRTCPFCSRGQQAALRAELV